MLIATSPTLLLGVTRREVISVKNASVACVKIQPEVLMRVLASETAAWQEKEEALARPALRAIQK